MIHATAIIHPGAELAEEVEIGPYAVIGAHVKIGKGTKVGPHAVVEGWTTIGEYNQIFQLASVGAIPQDLKYKGEETYLKIGDRNIIREFATINLGTVTGDGETTIGNDNLFMAYAHVAHDCTVGSNAVFANCAALGGHVEIGDWVILGGLTAVHQFTKVGAHAFLAGGAIVTRDVPPYVMVAGNPAVPHAVNTEGLKRRGFDAAQIRGIREAYRVLYRSELRLSEALERLEALGAGRPEVRLFVEFLRRSERSIVR